MAWPAPAGLKPAPAPVAVAGVGLGPRSGCGGGAVEVEVKGPKSNVPSCTCVTGMARGRNSAVSTSVNADSAEQTVASGAWKGGLIEDTMDGVNTRTLGVVGDASSSSLWLWGRCGCWCDGRGCDLAGGGVSRDVRSGRKDWIVRMGCNRWVLKRSAKLEGGMVAMGDVW